MSFGSGPYGDPPELVKAQAIERIAKALDLPPELLLPAPKPVPDNREMYREALGLEEEGNHHLVAAGGLCSPVTPVYTITEGSFIYLDQGTLDLGIVRDSVFPTAENDFTVFTEAFEGDK